MRLPKDISCIVGMTEDGTDVTSMVAFPKGFAQLSVRESPQACGCCDTSDPTMCIRAASIKVTSPTGWKIDCVGGEIAKKRDDADDDLENLFGGRRNKGDYDDLTMIGGGSGHGGGGPGGGGGAIVIKAPGDRRNRFAGTLKRGAGVRDVSEPCPKVVRF